ncbi:DMT family transporter [Hoeflea sp. TYP-13]|uniref:DMT family transporter n=1 Tax=Hoeflea sp. TYP-13 TaxID=3230023 RepID=UPI0034C6415D
MNVAAHGETDRTFEAAAMMAFAMLLLPLMDAAGKYLALYEGVTPGTSSLLRFALQTLFTLPVILIVSGPAALRPNYWGANLLRGLLLGWASALFLISVKYVPIADAIAVFFVEPFILTVLSAIFLHEKVHWPRWLAIVVGFLGAMLVIQPNFAKFGFVSLLPLGTATLFAVYLLLNRVFSARDNVLVMQYAAGIGGTLAIAVVMPAGTFLQFEDIAWSTPQTGLSIALLVAVGLISAYGHLIIVAAMRFAPASLLAPFQYFEIVSAAAVGYLVFGNFPTPSKWLGIAIIIGSGLFILWREQRRAIRRKREFSR